MTTAYTTRRPIHVARPGGPVVQLLTGAPVYANGDTNGDEHFVETPDGFGGWVPLDVLDPIIN